MKRALVFAVVLAVAVGLPVIAYSKDGTIPLDLTFTNEKGAGNGTIAGTFGGVPVSGTFSGDKASGNWILTVDGQPFSNGTYKCGDGGCVFTGTTLMGRPRAFEFQTSGLNGTFTGSLQGLFRNHGGWVSTVARWTNTTLGPGRVGKIVSSAARLGGTKVQATGEKVQGNPVKIQGNTGKVQDSTKIQGSAARAGGSGKVDKAKDADKKDRGNDTAGQGNGGGQSHGNGGGNDKGGGNGKR